MIIMTMLNIAITIRSFNHEGPAIKKLRDSFQITYVNLTGQRLSGNTLIHALREADGVIAGTEIFDDRVFQKSPQLQVISRVGTGLDSIDLVSAKQRGIRILSTPRSPVPAVTEHTLTLIFTVMKNIPYYNDTMRRGTPPVKPGKMLSGKKVGIVGLGRVGARVAAALDFFGCRISYFDPYTTQHANPAWKQQPSVKDLVRDIDILSLHASAAPDTPPIIDADVLSCCKKGIIIINTARGSLIDEVALADGLRSDQVSGAGLDVFRNEPYSGELLSFSQVVATPHVASNTTESRDEMEMEAADNLIKYFMEMNE